MMEIQQYAITNPWAVGGAALLALILIILVARKVRRITRNTPADHVLGNVVMVVGLGWSSEAMWEIARVKLHFDLPLSILLFSLFEAGLILSTMRAKKHLDEYGWPGRYGQTAWGIALVMGTVAAANAETLSESVVRFLIPLTVTKLWWDGLVGGAVRPERTESAWVYTPARLLVLAGLKKPGVADVGTVNRDHLTRRMIRLEFQRMYGPEGKADKVKMKLAKLSLSADAALLASVRDSVSLADGYVSSVSGVLANRDKGQGKPLSYATEADTDTEMMSWTAGDTVSTVPLDTDTPRDIQESSAWQAVDIVSRRVPLDADTGQDMSPLEARDILDAAPRDTGQDTDVPLTVDTAEGYLSRLSRGMDTDSVPAAPVSGPAVVVNLGTRPVRQRGMEDALDVAVAAILLDRDLTPADKATLAANHGVTTKTVGRRAAALKPAEEE